MTELDAGREPSIGIRFDVARRNWNHRRRQARGHSRDDVRFIDVPGATVRLRVREPSAGQPTVVFAADAPAFLEHYDRLLATLRDDVGVVAMELPGYGFSVPRSGFNYSPTSQCDVVEAVLTSVDLGPYVLCLSCVAGLLSLSLAQRCPEIVERIMLIQTPSWDEAGPWLRRIDPGGILERTLVGQLVMAAVPRRIAHMWFRASSGSRQQADELGRVADEAFSRGAGFTLASALQGMVRAQPVRIAPLSIPTMALWGEADRTHRRTDRAWLSELVPDVPAVHIEGAGHLPELECPELFRAHLLSFLSK